MSKVDIASIINSRISVMATSQAQFAKSIDATPNQFGLFLKGKGSLSTQSLNKCFEQSGIELSLYEKRIELAQKAAAILKGKGVKTIDEWTKRELVSFTQIKELDLFFDVEDEEQYVSIIESGCVDHESTFPFMKALISYYLLIDKEKPTSSEAGQALIKLLPENAKEDAYIKIQEEKSNTSNKDIIKIAKIAGSAAIAIAGIALFKQIGASTLFNSESKFSLNAKALFNLKGKK